MPHKHLAFSTIDEVYGTSLAFQCVDSIPHVHRNPDKWERDETDD
jgi:hypothetical protein